MAVAGARPRALVLLAIVAALSAMNCEGTANPQASSRATPSAPVTLTASQACERLRADVVRTGGVPEIRVLRDVADHVSDPRLAGDARTAVRDIEHTGTAPLAFLLLKDDCARAGVRIPAIEH